MSGHEINTAAPRDAPACYMQLTGLHAGGRAASGRREPQRFVRRPAPAIHVRGSEDVSHCLPWWIRTLDERLAAPCRTARQHATGPRPAARCRLARLLPALVQRA